MAQHLGVRPFVAGLLLVAFGTSVPELAVNARAVFEGQSHLALGNAVSLQAILIPRKTCRKIRTCKLLSGKVFRVCVTMIGHWYAVVRNRTY